MDREHLPPNVLSEGLVNDLLTCYEAMFLITTAKLAHLNRGDPFKERCGLYCCLILEILLAYMNQLVPEVVVDEDREVRPRNLLGQLTQRFMDRVVKKMTSRTRGGVVIDDVPPEMVDDVKALLNRTRREGIHVLNRYPLLQYQRTEFRENSQALYMLADEVLDRDAHVQALTRLNALRQFMDVIDTHNTTVDLKIRNRAKFRILQQRMRELRNVLNHDAQAYFAEQLGGNLNLAAYVHAVMRIRQSQRFLKFKFTDIVELQERVVTAIALFYERTEDLVTAEYEKFNLHINNKARLDYIVILRTMMLNRIYHEDFLDPFEDNYNIIQLVIPRNQNQLPTETELIELGARLAPEIQEEDE